MKAGNSRTKEKILTQGHLKEIAQLFRVLADESRLMILRSLMEGQKTVSELVEVTGLQQGNVSKHLQMLLGYHFVHREQKGNFALYGIADESLEQLCELMCGRVENVLQRKWESLRSVKNTYKKHSDKKTR